MLSRPREVSFTNKVIIVFIQHVQLLYEYTIPIIVDSNNYVSSLIHLHLHVSLLITIHDKRYTFELNNII